MVNLVGMFYGAKKFDLIRSTIKYGIKYSLGFSISCLVFFLAVSKYIIPFFTDSSEITQIAISYFSVVSFSYPFVTIGMTTGRIMQGLGRGTHLLFITLIRVILINAPLGWYLRRVLELPVESVWYCILLSSVIASSISIVWMMRIIKEQESKIASVT